ncbi:unnamed protein product, partial [Discosporangium mesarthrocarpum]
MRRHGRPPVVLDIGTGTGLLAMQAARAGAEVVYCCEMFSAMADVAREVTEANCPGKIKVFSKKSTDLVVGGEGEGEGGHMHRKADMCVNEIYDSTLLGEAVLPSLRHALTELLVEEPLLVPSSATVFGLLLSSSTVRDMHDISSTAFTEDVPVARNARAAQCRGGRKPLPLRAEALTDAVEL